MYNKYIIENLAQGTVNTTLTAWSTTLILWTWQGSLFPSTFPFILKLEWFTGWNCVRREIVKCTWRTSDTLTIVRSFENCPANYTALSQTNTAFQFEVADIVSLVISKESFLDIQNETSRLETDKLNLSWGTMTWVLNLKKSSNIASASVIDLSTATGNIIHITGTSWITSFINWTWRFEIIFDWILTLTHNWTSLILPTSANITTAVWDSMIIVNESWNNWKVISYQKLDWTVLKSSNPDYTILSFWDWSDWSATISTTITLTRDMFYSSLTINSWWILDPNWYKVYVNWALTINSWWYIRRNWNAWWIGWNWSAWNGWAGWTGWAILNQWNLGEQLAWWNWGNGWIYWANWVIWTNWASSNPSYHNINWVAWWIGWNWTGWGAWTGWAWGSWWTSTRWSSYNTIYSIINNITNSILRTTPNIYTNYFWLWTAWGWWGWAGWWGWVTLWTGWWGWWGWGSWWMIFLSVFNLINNWAIESKWWNWWAGWASYLYNGWTGWAWGWGSWGIVFLITRNITTLWTITLTWWTWANTWPTWVLLQATA